ncbi:MAG: rhodanese-like domain-containing protein [Pseudomonadota bacterium]
MCFGWLADSALADSYKDIQARRPELFHPETGYRIDRQRAPTPDDIPPPSRLVTADEAAVLIAQDAVAVDVFGALQSRYDELDGKWLVSQRRSSLPGAVWLPETGRGVLDETMSRYLRSNLERLTKADKAHPIIVFCVADCWMSWNAAQRIAKLGYQNVHWLRHGTDGWLDTGRTLAPVDPVPVNVEE